MRNQTLLSSVNNFVNRGYFVFDDLSPADKNQLTALSLQEDESPEEFLTEHSQSHRIISELISLMKDPSLDNAFEFNATVKTIACDYHSKRIQRVFDTVIQNNNENEASFPLWEDQLADDAGVPRFGEI